jgi:hypothetical protein
MKKKPSSPTKEPVSFWDPPSSSSSSSSSSSFSFFFDAAALSFYITKYIYTYKDIHENLNS